jgi:hypothetical protein
MNYSNETFQMAHKMNSKFIRQFDAMTKHFNYCDIQSLSVMIFTPDELGEFGFADLDLDGRLFGDSKAMLNDLLKDANGQKGCFVMALEIDVNGTFECMIERKKQEVADGDAEEEELFAIMACRDAVKAAE